MKEGIKLADTNLPSGQVLTVDKTTRYWVAIAPKHLYLVLDSSETTITKRMTHEVPKWELIGN